MIDYEADYLRVTYNDKGRSTENFDAITWSVKNEMIMLFDDDGVRIASVPQRNVLKVEEVRNA